MPAYRRIALPILGLATLLAPAGGDRGDRSASAAIDRSSVQDSAPAPAATARLRASLRACCAPATRGADVRSAAADAARHRHRGRRNRQLPLRDLARRPALPGRGRPRGHRHRRPADARARCARPRAARTAIESSGGLGFGGDGDRLAPPRHAHPARRRHERPRRAPASGLPAPRRRAQRRPPRRRVRRRHRAPCAASSRARAARSTARSTPATSTRSSRSSARTPSPATPATRPTGLPAPPLAAGDKAKLSSSGLAIAPEGAPECRQADHRRGQPDRDQALQVGRRPRPLGGLGLRLLGLGLLRAARRRPAQAPARLVRLLRLGRVRQGSLGHDLHELRPHLHGRRRPAFRHQRAWRERLAGGRPRRATPARSPSGIPPASELHPGLQSLPPLLEDHIGRSGRAWMRGRSSFSDRAPDCDRRLSPRPRRCATRRGRL